MSSKEFGSSARLTTAESSSSGLVKGWLSNLDFVTFALFAGLPQSGLGIADDLFLIGIPVDGASQSNGDIGKMADSHGAVMAVDITDGLSSVSNALEEVLHVIAGLFAFVEFCECFFLNWVGFQGINGFAGKLTAINEDATVGTFKHQAIVETEVLGGVANVQDSAVGEGGGDVEFGGCVILRRVGGHAICEGHGMFGRDWFDFYGAGIFEVESPCGDVDMVGSPSPSFFRRNIRTTSGIRSGTGNYRSDHPWL